MRRPVAVSLRGDKRFEDTVRDVVTEAGQDYVQFNLHGQIAVREILDCVWTAPRNESYDAKL